MYFPNGWPKVLNFPELKGCHIKQVTCNRDRVLFAILTDKSVAIWFCKVSLFRNFWSIIIIENI